MLDLLCTWVYTAWNPLSGSILNKFEKKRTTSTLDVDQITGGISFPQYLPRLASPSNSPSYI